MKLTKSQLKQIIKEELQLLKELKDEEYYFKNLWGALENLDRATERAKNSIGKVGALQEFISEATRAHYSLAMSVDGLGRKLKKKATP